MDGKPEATLDKNVVDSLSEIIKDNHTPKLIEVGKDANGDSVQALQGPRDLKLQSVKPLLDEYNDRMLRPMRRKGIHVVTALDSLIEMTNRFKDDDSIVFANNDITQPSITAVLNFHQHGGDLNSADNLARHGDHRVFHELKLSKEWKAWAQFNGKGLAQGDFAHFIEERISDVLMPDPSLVGTITDATTGGDFGERSPVEQLAYLAKVLGGSFASPSRLMELSRGLSVRESLAVKQVVNLDTGEGEIKWTSEHSDDEGQPLKIPNLFLIAIPVFENSGFAYRIAVQLRYRLGGGRLQWTYTMYRVELIFDAAIKEACAKVKAETELPLILGKPAA